MFVSFKVCLEHKTFTHGVSSQLSDVNRSLDGTSKLELIGFDRNDLDQWHLGYELLRILVVKAVVLNAPSGTLEINTLNISSLL